MHDDARLTFGEDGVVAVFAVDGEALLAALEQAVDMLVAEVPAAVALAEIAAERAHVSDLRAADVAGRRGQRREAFLQFGVLRDIRQLDAGTDDNWRRAAAGILRFRRHDGGEACG